MADFGFSPQLTAAATIAPYRFVYISGAFQGTQCTAITQTPVGVTDQSTRRFDDTDNHALAGDPISLQPSRMVQIAAAAAISVGAKIGSATDGRAQTLVTTNVPFGIAVTAATAAGEIIWVYQTPCGTFASA